MKNQITNRLLAFTNPVIGGNLGGESGPEAARTGETFVGYFVSIWNAFITVGAIMVLINFLWGALEWITAGGDSSKVEKGRNRITQSMIGLLILVSSFVIIGFVSNLFFGDDFNILKLEFNEPSETQSIPETEEDFDIDKLKTSEAQTTLGTESKISTSIFAPSVAYAGELNIGETASDAKIPGSDGYTAGNEEEGFGELITKILNIVMVIGAIMVLINFLWGALEWITSGGDSGKVEKGRNRITQSIIGLIVLASVVALFMLIQGFLGLEVLEFSTASI